MAREDPQMKLRLPAELKARVDEAAQHAGRSLNAEIVHRLERSFVADDEMVIPLLETLANGIEKILAGRQEAAAEQIKRAGLIQKAADRRSGLLLENDEGEP